MDTAGPRETVRVQAPAPTGHEARVPSAVMGTAMFIGVELMLFAGFISAFIIVKANFVPGTWPPPDQPRLPVEATAVTTMLLLASGVTLWRSGAVLADNALAARNLLALSLGLGSAFIGVQGLEWARLLAEGLTLQSSPYGAFFYLIVGAHALHALPALVALGVMLLRMQQGRLSDEAFQATRLFWYFVVLVWPVLYWKVYL
jgi:cytochrome c oxidase subunit 3